MDFVEEESPIEFAICDNCEKGIVIAMAWEDSEATLVLSCDCTAMETDALIPPDITPDVWK